MCTCVYVQRGARAAAHLRECARGVQVGGDPEVERHGGGDALDRHVAAHHDVEAHLARLGVRHRLVPDVVDVRVHEVVAVAWETGEG